ncbi:MAG TPA: alpha/beta fold hydrolase [Flavobacterium sp.]|jgi:phospholipase/carboxylesterase
MPLHHLVREPKIKLDKNPVLLLLHGYGSNEEDLFSFAPELPDEYFVISVRAPHKLPPYGHAWYEINFMGNERNFSNDEQARTSRDLISRFIEALPEKYPVDRDNITLIGFSQGCILSYAVALTYPEKVKRVVAMSGYPNMNIIGEGYEKQDFSGLRFFVSHGSADQTVPVDWGRKAKPLLDDLKINYMYKEYPVGHGVAPQNFFDVLNWLKNS